MKHDLTLKSLTSIFILFSVFVFSSCRKDADSGDSRTTTANPMAGMYKVRGSMYNYNGMVSWTGPSAGLNQTDPISVPAGYISVIDLAPFGPKTATVIDSVTVTIPFANFLIPANCYYWGMNPSHTTITYRLSPSLLSGYSNVASYIRHFVPPTPTQKMSIRIITQYNDMPGGTGNDHIVDEVFEQQ